MLIGDMGERSIATASAAQRLSVRRRTQYAQSVATPECSDIREDILARGQSA
jgi:hypothetical protein